MDDSNSWNLAAEQAKVGSKESEISLIENALISQEMIISTLVERLQPVLSPEYSDSAKSDVPQPLLSRIAELRIKITDNTSKLSDIIHRLET